MPKKSEQFILHKVLSEELCSVHFDDNSLSHAKLPSKHGGLGHRAATDLALTAFLSSRAACNSLVNDILHQPTNTPEDNEEVRTWLNRNLDLPSDSHKQRNWDDIQCSSAVATLVPLFNQDRLACFKAVSRLESGAFQNCTPYHRVGAFIGQDTLRIGVALRVSFSA